MKFEVRDRLFTDILFCIEADTIEAAASIAGRGLLGRTTAGRVGGAARVTGDPGLSGCFRTTLPGPNRKDGEVALGRQFHVTMT